MVPVSAFLRNKAAACLCLLIVGSGTAPAATISWAAHTWNITNGGMAGKYAAGASNVSVDSSGYLHLKISKSGTSFSCAELFSTDNMGFGTYQWQIDGPVDKLDKNIVLGLFPYGPEAGIGADGTNEIDIEYARWGNGSWPDGNYTVYPNSGLTVGSTTFNFTLSGTYTTSRFVWTSTDIVFTTLAGFKSLGDTTGTIKKWTYAPSSSSTNIPQRAMPLGMNLWICSNGCTTDPAAGAEIIIRNFAFVPLGQSFVSNRPQASTSPTVSFSLSDGKQTSLVLKEPALQDLQAQVFDVQGRALFASQVRSGTRALALPPMRDGIVFVRITGAGGKKNSFLFHR